MPSSADYFELYSKLRSSLLTRHFAFSRYFRANLLSNFNSLSKSGSDIATALAGGKTSDAQAYRWAFNYGGQPGEFGHKRENPLLAMGYLLTCLAVETILGGAENATKIIHLSLDALDSLYKFSGNHFEGYILRYDPVTSDAWITADAWVGEEQKLPWISPAYCQQFVINRWNQYEYNLPLNHPAYQTLLNDPERKTSWYAASQLRAFEPSADELVGLVMGYWMVYELVDDIQIKEKVKQQITKLADYLAEYSYLLVRPNGNFTYRGAGVAWNEFPLNQVFQKITGQDFSARHSFEKVLDLAGIWPALRDDYTKWSLVELGATVTLPAVATILPNISTLLAGIGLTTEIGTLGLSTDPLSGLPPKIGLNPMHIGQAFAFWLNRKCFELVTADAAQEFVTQYIAQLLAPRQRFQAWMAGSTCLGSWAVEFAPRLALMGLDDLDPTIRDAYLFWLPRRRLFDQSPLNKSDIRPTKRPLTPAVALLLSEDPLVLRGEEANLVALLQEKWNLFNLEITDPQTKENIQKGEYKGHSEVRWGQDLNIVDMFSKPADPNPNNGKDTYDGTDEQVEDALDYMIGLALSWLYTKRRLAKGQLVTTPGFPKLPNPLRLSSPEFNPVIPANVLELPLLDKVQIGVVVDSHVETHPFLDNTPPGKSLGRKPCWPLQNLELAAEQLLHDEWVTVPGDGSEVQTSFQIELGCEYALEAQGTITVNGQVYGPEGKTNERTYDLSFPLNGLTDPAHAYPYCLIGRVNNFFYIGKNIRREHFLFDRAWFFGSDSVTLYLRANIPSGTQGSGEFRCRVRVWKVPPTSALEAIAQRMDPVHPPNHLRELADCHRWLDSNPPSSVSLRKLLNRHRDERSTLLRFLVYNSHLMDVDVDFLGLVRDGFGLQGALALLSLQNIDALGVVKKLDNLQDRLKDAIRSYYDSLSTGGKAAFLAGASAILGLILPIPIVSIDQLFFEIDALRDPIGKSLEITSKVIKWTNEQLMEKLGLQDPIEILRMFGIDIPRIGIPLSPAVEERAVELGKELQEEYDLAALCEVWSLHTRDHVLSEWNYLPHRVQAPSDGPYAGPYGPTNPFNPLTQPLLGSGLLVTGRDRAIWQGAQHTFSCQGVTRIVPPFDFSKLVDADNWAMKGVNLTLVNVGLGTLEIYNTHLYSGGINDNLENSFSIPGLPWPSSEEKSQIRRTQLAELITFYQRHHHPENVALIVGDFNIDANDDPDYNVLVAQMNTIGMVDSWKWQRRHGGLDLGCTIGEANLADRFENVCPVETKDERFCQDPTYRGRPARRYDYIFIEKPSANHTFNLDISRIRRRPFQRTIATGGERYLSDHLGLDVTLMISPRD